MASSSAMSNGEPDNEASVDGFRGPYQSDSGDYEVGVGLNWTKNEMRDLDLDLDVGNHFLFEDDLSPPIPIDPRYFEDPTNDEDEENTGVLKLLPDICTTPVGDICSQIGPMMGSLSYCYFSLSNMDPSWFGKAFGSLQGKVSNMLWLQAHVGAGLYIFSRRHIRTLSTNRALMYSVLGSVLFNFGSCMVWGLGRALFKASPNGCRAFGLASSCLLLYAAQDYLQCVDDRCSELD